MIHESFSNLEYVNIIKYGLDSGLFNSSTLELRELCERLERLQEDYNYLRIKLDKDLTDLEFRDII